VVLSSFLASGFVLTCSTENTKKNMVFYMERVLVESPFKGEGATEEEKRMNEERNKQYARACLRDCLQRGEAPFASHLLYTQEGVLDDNLPKERALGIEAGLVWGEMAEKTVVYTDLGITDGMKKGIKRANEQGRLVEHRNLS
jgi:hypothetical protein